MKRRREEKKEQEEGTQIAHLLFFPIPIKQILPCQEHPLCHTSNSGRSHTARPPRHLVLPPSTRFICPARCLSAPPAPSCRSTRLPCHPDGPLCRHTRRSHHPAHWSRRPTPDVPTPHTAPPSPATCPPPHPPLVWSHPVAARLLGPPIAPPLRPSCLEGRSSPRPTRPLAQ